MREAVSKIAWLALGATTALVILEVLLRSLPVSEGLYRTGHANRWPLEAYKPDFPYTYSKSWELRNVHHGTTNNYGHIAPYPYSAGSRPVVVIGDSFVESLMNRYEDTLQGQLGAQLGSRELAYGLGFSGLSAADFLALSRLARDEFAPTAAVFVIIDGDFSESVSPRVGNYYFEAKDGSLRLAYLPIRGETLWKRIRRSVGEIAIYAYVFGNLGFSFDSLLALPRKEPGNERRPNDDEQLHRKVVDRFLASLPVESGIAKQCIAFVLDADRYAIYNSELASVPKDKPSVRRYFLQQAHKLGYAVSDLDSVFRARYARERAKFDYWPNDRHWNKLGHRVAAEEAYRLLFSGDKPECMPAKALTAAFRP